MTTETILTPAQVDSLLEGVLRASGSRLGNYTYQKTLDDLRSAIRAIEQAVLQSPEVQALRKDAERYQRLVANWFNNNHDGEFILMNNKPPEAYGFKADIDDAITAMEKQP